METKSVYRNRTKCEGKGKGLGREALVLSLRDQPTTMRDLLPKKQEKHRERPEFASICACLEPVRVDVEATGAHPPAHPNGSRSSSNGLDPP